MSLRAMRRTGKHTPPARQSAPRTPRSAFTLIEVLVAMAVTLILMGIVVTIFGLLGDNVSKSRAAMEMSEQLRGVKQRLQADLAGLTATTLPPLRPERDGGYLEIIEGPVGRIENGDMRQAVTVQVPNENGNPDNDTSVGDNDDFFMFTTRSRGEPFVGRFYDATTGTLTTLQSPVAEIAWFLRGTTLYRRVLLVKPSVTPQIAAMSNLNSLTPKGFYANYDLSAHLEGGNFDLFDNTTTLRLVANSLGDLTKRENRFAHRPRTTGDTKYYWPHESREWGSVNSVRGRLGLPTLQECSHPDWWTTAATPNPLNPFSSTSNPALTLASTEFDAWKNPNPWAQVNTATGILTNFDTGSPRIGEDVILTNVLQFDVKVWDPLAPVFTVDPTVDPANNGWLVAPSDPKGTLVIMPGDPGYATALSKWTGSAVTFGAYVDLNYAYTDKSSGNSHKISWFSGPGDPRSGLAATTNYPAAIYDTWSTHYEHDGIDQDRDGRVDEFTDGFDGDTATISDGIVDNPGEPFTDTNEDGDFDSGELYTDVNSNGTYDPGEQEAPPPYAHPLRGIQIKIRTFEPDSRQIREVTIVQDFLPE